MSIYANRYTAQESLAASEGFISVLGDIHPGNPFLSLGMNRLINFTTALRSSMDYHNLDNLIAASDESDNRFNKAYVNFRNMVEMKSSMTEYGHQALSCAQIAGIIESHDRELHNLPKKLQISMVDAIIEKIDDGSETTLVDKAGVRPLYNSMVKHHVELKKIEKQRSEAAKMEDLVAAPSEVAKEVKRQLSIIYTHLEDFSLMGDASSNEKLKDLNRELQLTITRVKKRLNKEKKEEI